MTVLATIYILFLVLTLKVSCQKSLTFVIDDTKSMVDSIKQVRKAVGSIIDIALDENANAIDNVLLVTFNDTESRVKNVIEKDLKVALAKEPNNWDYNYECPEMSLSGIERALESSPPGSHIIVFTDASAKDFRRSYEIQRLCKKKQSQIIFLLTGDCHRPYSSRFQVYYDIATASSGLAFRVDVNEVEMVLDSIREAMKGDKIILTENVTQPDNYTKVPFTIESHIDYAVLFVTGLNVSLELLPPVEMEKIMWTKHGKVVKITRSGKYFAVVKSTNETSVIVTGASDFFFSYGFSEKEPKSSKDITPKPYKDSWTYLSVLVQDPKSAIKIQSAQILDTQGNIFAELPLTTSSSDFYSTKLFVGLDKFKVAVNGIAPSGQRFKRISGVPVSTVTPVAPEIDSALLLIEVTEMTPATITCRILDGQPEPEISWKTKAFGSTDYMPITNSGPELRIDHADLINMGHYKCIAVNPAGSDEQVVAELIVLKAPVVIIVEGTRVTVDYGSRLTLTCKVTANPKPNVEWRTDRGNVMKNTENMNKFEYIYITTFKNVKKSGTYYCNAENSQGTDGASIEVSVSSPLIIHSKPPVSVIAKYGTEVRLHCDITSKFPMHIQWYHSTKVKEIETSDLYLLKQNGEELKINSMDIGLDGKYICKASLLDDDNVHVELATELKIDGIEAPQVKIEGKDLRGGKTVKKGDSVSIKCSVIKGVPKPKINWQFKSVDDVEFEYIQNSGAVLDIPNIQSRDSGSYKCIAQNALGTDNDEVQLTVDEPPSIIAEEDTTYYGLLGDIAMRIPCDVVGIPKPTTEWKVEGLIITPDQKYAVEDGALIIKNPELSDTNLYTCTATNYLGSDTKAFNGSVSETLQIEDNFKDLTLNTDNSINLECMLPHAEGSIVKWFVGDLNIGADLYIPVDDDGNYTCHVSETHGSATETYVVRVVHGPRFLYQQDDPVVELTDDTTEMLHCEVDAIPDPDIVWMHDGSFFISNLFLLPVSKQGNYSCIVSNVYGSVERKFVVTGPKYN